MEGLTVILRPALKQPGFYLQAFLYLQLLDLLTTLVGFKLGFSEASPFIRWLIQFGPVVGVALSKLVAVALAAICILTRRDHLLRYVCYWYALLVIWNLSQILFAPMV